MIDKWQNDIRQFVALCNEHGVNMLLIGGGAVNFHGYQRHSADIDFWINPTKENLERLLQVLKDMDYEISELPKEVYEQQQNISLKFSPDDLDVELITRFSINKSFEKAFKESIETHIEGFPIGKYRVLSLSDLILSKIKSGRPKDLLDVQQLQSVHKKQ